MALTVPCARASQTSADVGHGDVVPFGQCVLLGVTHPVTSITVVKSA